MPSQGDKVNWSDVTAIYSALNTARTKFGFSTISPTSRQGQYPVPSDISNINAFITEMASNKNLTSIAVGVAVPARSDYLKPSFLNTLASTITSIQNANNFGNSSFGDSSFSFSNSGFSFSNSSWSFGDSSWSFGNSSWSNSSFSNSGFSFFGGGDGNHYGQAWG